MIKKFIFIIIFKPSVFVKLFQKFKKKIFFFMKLLLFVDGKFSYRNNREKSKKKVAFKIL